MGKELDELLDSDQDTKINWLIGQVYEIRYEINTIKDNHLFHLDEEIKLLKRKFYYISTAVVTILTGQNILM